MGKSILNFDLEQVRYFTNGTYDLNKLLGINYLSNQEMLFSNENYWDCRDWDTERNYCFSNETSVGEIFIDDNLDSNLKSDCKVELNTGNLEEKSIVDSSGNAHKGLLIGDYKIRKSTKGRPMIRDSFIKVPKKNNSGGAL